jgi:hypothetical protein
VGCPTRCTGWRSQIHGRVERVRLPRGLVDNIGRLEPLTVGAHPRELVVATRNPEWTALFDNGANGGDPATTFGYLAEKILCQGLVVDSIPSATTTGPRRYGAILFAMFGPVRTHFLSYVRTVSVTQDGTRWRFDQGGTVQDFEDLEADRRRRVIDRFMLSMLIDYAAALGVHPFDPDFYVGPSVLVMSPLPTDVNLRSVSIAEAQRMHGIRLTG